METWLAIYICTAGCGSNMPPIPGSAKSTPSYSQETCESNARLVAQGMYVLSGGVEKWGYRCERVDYEPPKVAK